MKVISKYYAGSYRPLINIASAGREENRLPTLTNNARRSSFARLKSDWQEECEDCSIVSFCMGDCTRFRFRRDSGYQNVNEYCTAVKTVYRDIKRYLFRPGEGRR